MKINKKIIYVIFIAFIIIPFIRIVVDSSKTKKDYKAFENEPRIINEGKSNITEIYDWITLTKSNKDESHYDESYKSLTSLDVNLSYLHDVNFNDFSNILRFKDVENIKYTGRVIPKDFSYVLNQFPNLKVINFYEAKPINKENYDSIKDLKTETLNCNVDKKEYFSIFNTMKGLKNLYVNSNFDVLDFNPLTIENETIETLNLHYLKSTSNRMLHDFVDVEIIKNNTDIIKLDTKNLKHLTLFCSYQLINFEVMFNCDDVSLESITVKNAESIKFSGTHNKIKVKKLVLDNINFNRFNVKEDLKDIDLDSVRSLVIEGNSSQNLTNIDFVKEFRFLDEFKH